jgi:hypothetical protein
MENEEERSSTAGDAENAMQAEEWRWMEKEEESPRQQGERPVYIGIGRASVNETCMTRHPSESTALSFPVRLFDIVAPPHGAHSLAIPDSQHQTDIYSALILNFFS